MQGVHIHCWSSLIILLNHHDAWEGVFLRGGPGGHGAGATAWRWWIRAQESGSEGSEGNDAIGPPHRTAALTARLLQAPRSPAASHRAAQKEATCAIFWRGSVRTAVRWAPRPRGGHRWAQAPPVQEPRVELAMQAQHRDQARKVSAQVAPKVMPGLVGAASTHSWWAAPRHLLQMQAPIPAAATYVANCSYVYVGEHR